MLSGETTNANFIVFGLMDLGSNPLSTTLEASMLTITPPVVLVNHGYTLSLYITSIYRTHRYKWVIGELANINGDIHER